MKSVNPQASIEALRTWLLTYPRMWSIQRATGSAGFNSEEPGGAPFSAASSIL